MLADEQTHAVVHCACVRARFAGITLYSPENPLPGKLRVLSRSDSQFTRADYAAIALCEEDDRMSFRLRAAGPYGRILPQDMSISDEASQAVCPAVYMLHVARTGKVSGKDFIKLTSGDH